MFVLRVSVVVLLISSAVTDELSDVLNKIFVVAKANKVQSAACEPVEGRLFGCNECYPCNHSTITTFRKRNNAIQLLKLNNNTCFPTEVCCVSQLEVTQVRLGNGCGRRNPDGAGVRLSRKGPRDVLPGEYPWTAYIYRKNSNKPTLLCGATLVSDSALLTTAQCVLGLAASTLSVSFARPPVAAGNTRNIASVTIHEDFDATKNHNDLALLVLALDAQLPHWVAPVCLSSTKVPHATPCIAIAPNNYFINTVVPLPGVCGDLHASQMCTVIPPGDRNPRHGSGLFCEDQFDTSPVFILYGVASTSTSNDVTNYTNLNYFSPWLSSKLED